ncbi:MAG: SMP-30/gluconolactonase/LRE family protein [Steroidobacteraceae bacterium]
MSPTVAHRVCDAGAMIGESPLWSGGQLLWTDPLAPRLLIYSNDTLRLVPTARSVWSLAGLPRGGICGTLDAAFCAVEATGVVQAGVDAPIDAGCRFSDMTVDPSGGLWAGVMHRGVLATRGVIFHASSLDEAPHAAASGLGVPNGMKFSSDGSKLYVVDTLMRTLLAYPARGSKLGEPVIISDFLGVPGKPDGMTLRPDGTFWVAMWGGGCVVQLASDGATLRQIAVPAPHVSSLCFLTPDRLFVTTSRMRLSPRALADNPGSGALFEINL